jgi:acetyl coA synthetase subunit ?
VFGKHIYKSISEVDHEIQGAVVVVAAKFAVKSVEDLMKKGAKWITVVTGGFAESKTEEGKAAQVGAHNPAYRLEGDCRPCKAVQLSYHWT